jgi:heme oxygenase (mycobilin-producing)
MMRLLNPSASGLRRKIDERFLFEAASGVVASKMERLSTGRFDMIRVMIERRCHQGKEKELRDLLIELRSEALRQLGYISGETLRDWENPSNFVVISTWTTLEAWKTWQTARQRLAVEEMMDTLLMTPRKIRVFVEDYDA